MPSLSEPSQRVQITVQGDGTVRVRVNLPLDVEHSRLFDQSGFFDSRRADTERNFRAACAWAQGLLDFNRPPSG